jgi:hypothetical protein
MTGELGAFHFFSGTPAIIVGISQAIIVGIVFALIIGFMLFLVRVLFRKTWAAIAVCIALFAALFLPGESSIVSSAPILLAMAIFVFGYFRIGLLATASGLIYLILLVLFPITTRLSALHSGIGLTGLVLLLALALYAFYTSLGGQPIFDRASLED